MMPALPGRVRIPRTVTWPVEGLTRADLVMIGGAVAYVILCFVIMAMYQNGVPL